MFCRPSIEGSGYAGAWRQQARAAELRRFIISEMLGRAFVRESGTQTRRAAAELPAALDVNLVTELPVTV